MQKRSVQSDDAIGTKPANISESLSLFQALQVIRDDQALHGSQSKYGRPTPTRLREREKGEVLEIRMIIMIINDNKIAAIRMMIKKIFIP